jgi:hypothetical protein
MRALIILGLIPGTNITISFSEWLGILDILTGIYLIFKLEHKQRILGEIKRQPLHANQLHQRA